MPYAVPTRSAHEQNGPEPGTQGASAGRGRKDATHLPVLVTDETSALDPVLLLRFLLVLGFRRVRPGNVLEHPLRRALHAAIVADPGLDLAGCAAATGANRETLRYHLAFLVCCGKVAEETRSGSVRYFSHDPALTPIRRALLHALRNESLAPTLAGIRDAPGISRQVLADRLGVTGPSVTRQVQRLIEDGLVQAERFGRSQCYRLTEACRSALEPALAKGIAGGQVSDRAST
ncbi:MAG: winged helix-turn-helix transcriptional regulator [Methanospirillum sp.]